MQVFGWASNLRDARELAYIHAGCTVSALAGVSEPAAGMREWLAALANFNVPCALVSRLDKATVRRLAVVLLCCLFCRSMAEARCVFLRCTAYLCACSLACYCRGGCYIAACMPIILPAAAADTTAPGPSILLR